MSDERRRIKRAVALRYQPPKDKVPVVTAKGQGPLAERIIKLAQENDIPIHQDRNLVQVLSALDLEAQIPAEAYGTVAALLAFLYKLNKNKR